MPNLPSAPLPILLSWSGGKDSAWALHLLRQGGVYEVVGLLTTLNERFRRVAIHGFREELLEQQAASIGLPLWKVDLPFPCTNADYESRMAAVFARAVREGLHGIAFGDLFLEDIRAYRIARLAGTGLTPIFPVWCPELGLSTAELARQMLAAGVRAHLTCVDPHALPASFAGRSFDAALLADLPATVDPCGERGEFHTFASDGPCFRGPIAVTRGEIVERDAFVYADLVPGNSSKLFLMKRTACSVAALAAAALTLLPASYASAQNLSADGAPQTFNYLASHFFTDVYFKYSPTNGTASGLHQYDTQLEDYAPATIHAEIAALHTYEKKVAAIDPSALDGPVAGDRDILLSNIRSELLSLEAIRGCEKNPDNYSSGITNSAFVIMERPYAPANTRLRALIEREKLMPKVLDEARKNLKNPPKIFTEIALEQIDGDISFFENDVPSAFFSGADGAEVANDTAAKAEFAKTNAAVIAALKSYGTWMKSDLLPRSNGDFRLGADTFAKKLSYDEMVDIPLDRLLAIAMDDLHKNQAEFARIAKEVDPSKTPQEVLAELATIHPAPDQLLNAFHGTFDSLIGYIREHHIITIPSDVQPTLEETPPFMRATTFASMDPPGPFETHSKKAYFNVTLPEKDWTAQHVAEHMASFNVGTIVSTSVHEAYPGHYVQFLWMPQFGSDIRKVLGANTNIEGWAHYCEQMMLDQGYAAAPPNATPDQVRQAKLIRLGQIQDALLRDARFVNSIKLHTGTGEPGGKWTIDQAVDFFAAQGYQSRSVGLVETKRGTGDPTYLYYTLGKLEIMKLREDYRRKKGAAFTIQDFHDTFMKQGFAPIKVVRKAMLGDDSTVL